MRRDEPLFLDTEDLAKPAAIDRRHRFEPIDRTLAIAAQLTLSCAALQAGRSGAVEQSRRPIGCAQRLRLAEQWQQDEEYETRQSLWKPRTLTREDVAANDELLVFERPLQGQRLNWLSRLQPCQPCQTRPQLGHELLVLIQPRVRSERLRLPVLSGRFGAALVIEIAEDLDRALVLDALGGSIGHCHGLVHVVPRFPELLFPEPPPQHCSTSFTGG